MGDKKKDIIEYYQKSENYLYILLPPRITYPKLKLLNGHCVAVLGTTVCSDA